MRAAVAFPPPLAQTPAHTPAHHYLLLYRTTPPPNQCQEGDHERQAGDRSVRSAARLRSETRQRPHPRGHPPPPRDGHWHRASQDTPPEAKRGGAGGRGRRAPALITTAPSPLLSLSPHTPAVQPRAGVACSGAESSHRQRLSAPPPTRKLFRQSTALRPHSSALNDVLGVVCFFCVVSGCGAQRERGRAGAGTSPLKGLWCGDPGIGLAGAVGRKGARAGGEGEE